MPATITEICGEIEPLLKARLFHPILIGAQLDAVISRFMEACSRNGSDDPVTRVNAALPMLQVSNTAFWGDTERPVGPQWALNASITTVPNDGSVAYVFKNVVPGGVAANHGIEAGDILLSVNQEPVTKTPLFNLGKSYTLTVLDRTNKSKDILLSLTTPAPKDRPPMSEPPSLLSSAVRPGIGLIRVFAFPGIIGFDFAHQLTQAVRRLQSENCTRFVVDLRANHGGGLGSLRLMSLLTPKKMPVGYSLSRAARDAQKPESSLPVIDRIPDTKFGLLLMALKFKFLHKDRSLRLVTEGISDPLRERVAILVDETSRGGAENVAAFAKENSLATIVGNETPGENLGAANFRIAQTHHLRIPLVGWFSHAGSISKGVRPDYSVSPTFAGLRSGKDEVLERALAIVQ